MKFKNMLHDTGFTHSATGRKYKLFTFSKLNMFPFVQTYQGFADVQQVNFIFSTANDEIAMHFLKGISSDNKFHLDYGDNKMKFNVDEIGVVRRQELTNLEWFSCDSPIVASTARKNDDGNLRVQYLNYKDEKFRQAILNNLIHKYEVIYDREYEGDKNIEIEFAKDYLRRKNNIQKNITIKEGTPEEHPVIGYEAPFKINADPKLIQIGYECGFGEKNSMGFGCAKRIKHAECIQ